MSIVVYTFSALNMWMGGGAITDTALVFNRNDDFPSKEKFKFYDELVAAGVVEVLFE